MNIPSTPSRGGAVFLGCIGLVFVAVGSAVWAGKMRSDPFEGPASGVSSSVLFEHVAGSACVAFGGMIVSVAWSGYHRANSLRRLQIRHPDSPWRWRPDWAEGIVLPDSGSSPIGVTIAAAVVGSSAVAGVLGVCLHRVQTATAIIGLLVVQPMFAIGVGAIAVSRIRARFTHGRVPLVLDTLPTVQNPRLVAHLDLPAYATWASCTLAKARRRGHSEGSLGACSTECEVDVQATSGDSRLVISVALPGGVASEQRSAWRLHVTALTGTGRFDERYDVPIVPLTTPERSGLG